MNTFIEPYYDPVRLKALDYCKEQILKNNTEGSVGELGVSEGGFAKYIGLAFPDRALHLFDTFWGWEKKQVEYDQKKGWCSQNIQHISRVQVEKVKENVRHLGIVIHEGLFKGEMVQGTFAFVSLDVDLYIPTKQGLEVFWPKLSDGGFILIDDYGNPDWKGVKEAVREFLEKTEAYQYIKVKNKTYSLLLQKIKEQLFLLGFL